MSAISPNDVASLLRVVNSSTLRVKQLATLLGRYSISKTGVKADQQHRLSNFIRDVVRQNNASTFHSVFKDVFAALNKEIPPHIGNNPTDKMHTSSPASARGYHTSSPAVGYTQGWTIAGLQNNRQTTQEYHIQYKVSPFYEIKKLLGPIVHCGVARNMRSRKEIKISAQTQPELHQVSTDNRFRVYAMATNLTGNNVDITFPHVSQIRVNDVEVKANLRGIKKRPGSTRPVDITEYLHLLDGTYVNSVELIYETTNQDFYFGVYVCRVKPVEELLDQIVTTRRITKATVVANRNRSNGNNNGPGEDDESEIEAMAEKLSLKCPLSCSRLNIPCRGQGCSHLQCFDGMSYLLLQQQGPTWQCPICNKDTPYERLAVDEYLQDILSKTDPETEDVMVEPNGEWYESKPTQARKPQPTATAHVEHFAIDDDAYDLSEYAETPPRNRGTEANPDTTIDSIPVGLDSTPNGTGGAGTKRKVVIDLTLSDDEEEDDRPAKRTAVGYPEQTPMAPLLPLPTPSVNRAPLPMPVAMQNQMGGGHPSMGRNHVAYPHSSSHVAVSRWLDKCTPDSDPNSFLPAQEWSHPEWHEAHEH